MSEIHGTTILSVRKKDEVVIIGDGQVTMGNAIVMKSTAKKVKRLSDNNIVSGFAGSTADAFTLFERLEAKLIHGGLMPTTSRTKVNAQKPSFHRE